MKRRSGEAQAALGRKAGAMKHRLEPKGGARNTQADLLPLPPGHKCTDICIIDCEFGCGCTCHDYGYG